MARLPIDWRTWFDTAIGKRNRINSAQIGPSGFEPMIVGDNSSPPDPAMLAYGLRQYAGEGGQCPPEFLSALADLFDPSAQHEGFSARIVRPKGGKAARLDAWAIGQEADTLAERDGYESAIAAICERHRCSESTAKAALALFRDSVAAHADALREE